MMQAIAHGYGDSSKVSGNRGIPPKSIAGKYSSTDGPESKDNNRGGNWDEKNHAAHKNREKEKKKKKKKSEKDLNKALIDFISSQGRKGAGCLVINKDGYILLGKRNDSGEWSTPGGHVDEGEDFETAAIRELQEETGLKGKDPEKIHCGEYRGYKSETFLIRKYSGKLKGNGEMHNLRWFQPTAIPFNNMTDYARDCIEAYITHKLAKSKKIQDMLDYEELQKNTIRSGGGTPHNVIHEVTHGDALKLVGNGVFRMLRQAVEGMGDEDFRDIKVDNYTLHLRRHTSDVYSGRIDDGHKQVHQFTNKSLPALSVELMSVFEWYLPEDQGELEIMDEGELSDDVISGGINALMDKYKKHNINDIYIEMENIREEIRQGTAVDLQQVEKKIMQLFDKLEVTLLNVVDNHNKLARDAGSAIDELEQKLRDLQNKVEDMGNRPMTYEAVSSSRVNDKKVHDEYYPYLTRPSVTVSPDGKIRISFDGDWTSIEQSNFLNDLKAKVIKRGV